MNKITILAIGAVFVASILAITAFEAEAKPPAQAICPAENVQHWYSLSFIVSSVGFEFVHPTLPTLDKGPNYYIKLSSSSEDAVEIDQEVADQLNEIGYQVRNIGTGELSPVTTSIINSRENFIPDLYSTICAEN